MPKLSDHFESGKDLPVYFVPEREGDLLFWRLPERMLMELAPNELVWTINYAGTSNKRKEKTFCAILYSFVGLFCSEGGCTVILKDAQDRYVLCISESLEDINLFILRTREVPEDGTEQHIPAEILQQWFGG